MASTFDIVVRERGITELETKLGRITTDVRLSQSALNNLNSTLANVSRTARAMPKINLNVLQNFNASKVVTEINKITKAVTDVKGRVDALGTSLRTSVGADLSPILRQISNVADALERAARASRDIRPPVPPAPPRPGSPNPPLPPTPPLPPAPPVNAPQVTAAWQAYAKGIALFASVGLGVTGLTQMSDQYTNLKNRISSVAYTTDQANQMLARTFEIANAAQAPVAEVGNAYARYYRALAPLGYTSQEVASVTETVAKALKLSGATASEAGSVLLQLSQAFSKGKLDGDEFRSVLENFPGLGQALAKALDIKPVGNFMAKLFELKEEGKITSQVMVEAFQGMKSEIDAQMGDVTQTFGGAIQVLSNSATEFFGKLGEQSGVVSGMTTSIKYLAENFDTFGRVATAVLMGLATLALPAVTIAIKAMTAAFMANPIGAVIALFVSLIAYVAQSEKGFEFLKNTVTVVFNSIYNIIFSIVNQINAVWNDLVSGLSSGLSLFSQDVANAVNQAKVAQREMRGFLQDTTWSPDYKAPAPTGIVSDIAKGASGEVKSIYENMATASGKTLEYYKTLKSASDLLKAQNKTLEASNLLREGAVFNEESLKKATQIVTVQEEHNSRILTQQGVISEYRKKSDEASHQRRIQTLTKEATQIKDLNVQQRAKNELIQEELNLSLSKFAGKKGFEGAKNAEDVKKLIEPSTMQMLSENANQTVNQRLGDARKSLGVSSAIKEQNKKPKKESEKATEASEYARLTDEIKRTTSALGKYGLEQDVSNKLAQIENQLANKELKLLPDHRTALEGLLAVQVREQAIQKASEKIYDSSKGAVEQLKIEEEGLKKALSDKIINQQRYNELLNENKVRLAELNIQNKLATEADYALINANEQKKASEELYNQLLRGSSTELAKLTGQEQALTKARSEGLISQQKYNQEMLKSALTRQQAKFDKGGGNFKDAVQGGFMESVANMGAGLPQIQQDFATFFTSINDGFADSFGKAIVMGEDLKTSLSNVAKQGLAELLSGLIKVGLQWLFMETLKETLGIGSANASSSSWGSMIFGGGAANQNGQQQQQKAGTKIGAYNNVPTQGQAGVSGSGGIPGQIASIGQTTTDSLGEATNSFSSFFSMVGNGFQTVFGDANKQTQQLGLNIEDVANNALSTLINALVQVMVQWLVMEVVGATLGKSAEMTSAASAGTLAAAWAPAAAMASLATLGANAAPASAAVIGVTALTTGLSMATQAVGFKDGGYTGNGGVNDIAGVVHRKEWVVDAETTAANRPLLESLSPRGGGRSSGGSSRGSFTPNIVINNMGTPQNYSVESMTADEIRLTARDEAERIVAKRTPEIMSKQIADPNSRFSKSMGQNIRASRRRTG